MHLQTGAVIDRAAPSPRRFPKQADPKSPQIYRIFELVTIHDVRATVEKFPRSYEVLVGGRVKFRVGRIVYLSFSRDETIMGFAFPKEEREWLIGGSPDKFMHPTKADLRYNWVLARLAALDKKEMRELVLDAWRMVVPKGVANRTTTAR